MHRIDENVSADLAPLLDYLRGLQRRYQTAVVLFRGPRVASERVDGLALHVEEPLTIDPHDTPAPSALDRIEALLAEATVPLSLKSLRSAAKMRAATVSDAIVTQAALAALTRGYLLIAR